MREDLLRYYERELSFIRRMSEEFAARYPKVAGRLLLEPGKSQDPHVERLIESCALLAARVQLKLDDEFPQITESLLQVLYPHYLAPVPSMSIVQFTLDPEQGKLTSGYRVERHRTLYARPSQDTVCRFRTCYPTTLWPIEVEQVKLDHGLSDGTGRVAPSAISISLRTVGDARLSELELESLRFFLNGESAFVGRLYETLLGHCYRVEVRSADTSTGRAPLVLPFGSIAEVGFAVDEGMLPYSHRSFVGYRLLQEYFQFPEKFFFFDILNLRALRGTRFSADARIVLFLDAPAALEQEIRPDQLRLGCTPVVNLYQQVAEPIRLDHAHAEYRVVPDQRRQRTTEVYSIDTVSSVARAGTAVTTYQPFYSFKHAIERREQQTFWHSSRRPSERHDDPGTEVFLSLVDLDFRPSLPPTEVLTIQVTCTNRDLPGMLPFGDPAGDFDMEGAAPVKRINCLTKPTRTLRPPVRRGLQWRLISHLSLNYLSAVEGGPDRSPEVFREILRLYDFGDTASVQQQIAGLAAVSSRQVMRRIRAEQGSGFARGMEATLEFDESRYVGTGVYLFSSILEKFLGLYVSINSFSEMVAVSQQRGLLKRWPPRSGQQVLL